ncbi:MAG: aldehyde dehydrogenase, partial [Acidimicrobiia bacterium]|nr:aldehyde dehydrogenase [Acidimicrobiia bacterium]
FADLVDAGYVAFEYGGAEVGRRLTNDPDVTSIHVTGSARTYNAIVYGSDQEAERRRVRDERLNPRAISAELGGVTPVIVVPGRWSRADIRFQAEHIVSQKMHNSGFNCVAAQVLVLPDGWEHTQALISEISDVMASLADRPPYYPGSAERCEAAAQQTASTTRFGTDAHRYLVTDLDSSSDSPWFTDEIFGPALAVTTVSGPDVATYLANAVDFANDELAGTLGANLLVDPRTQKRHAAAVEQAVADLRYGTVCINAWVGVAYFMSRCAWGAAPGHTPAEIGSGVGHVHNALMFDEPVKSVVRGPFAPAPRTFLKGDPHVAPKMIYFVTNRQANVVGRKLIDYCAHPSKIRLASIVASAVRG